MSGMMLMYTVTLGSYFNYILKNKILSGFQDYSSFRSNTNVKINHSIILLGQIIVSIISLILNYNKGFNPLCFSLIVPIIMLVLHTLTGFGEVENLVNSGKKVEMNQIEKYVTWNIPLHIIYFILYLISAEQLLSLF
ncbi:hypothetical protein HMPREF9129_0928 [Peptoniphilus indolicus ATCC 29427]|uniref:Uncharacterized protein n=2 Tax=Peptoniphilus indolicus TaxID=33030 RepID=G4D3E8_9FIRM|nr:hypothetical protein HMPREF9129_0928 [Peptoniphilus indolicus ATCC 29427]